MNVGDRIKSARILAGLTQEELGSCCGASKQTIFKYETGVITNIPLDKVEMIAAKLNVSPAYLMGWDDVPNSSELTDIELDSNLLDLLTEFPALTPSELTRVADFIRGLIASRENDNK